MHRLASLLALALLPAIASANTPCRFSADRNFDVPASGLATVALDLGSNDVVIEGPYVSRRHCAILVHASEGCEIYDIASKNGTYVNGLRLCGPTQLHAGDELRMCDRQFTFMSKSAGKDEPGHGSTRVGS